MLSLERVGQPPLGRLISTMDSFSLSLPQEVKVLGGAMKYGDFMLGGIGQNPMSYFYLFFLTSAIHKPSQW